MVLIASLYVWFFASIADIVAAEHAGSLDARDRPGPGHRGHGAGDRAGAVGRAPRRRRRDGAQPAATGGTWGCCSRALAVQVVLSVYWLVRLSSLTGGRPGPRRRGSSRSRCSSPPGRWSGSACCSPVPAGAGSTPASRPPRSADRGTGRIGGMPAVPPAPTALDPEVAALLRHDPAGLVAAVVQQHDTGEVLMVAWMDDEALHRTLTTGRATYWSRSRGEYWVKGETSGNRQWVREVRLDCDGDALLVLVDQEGAACHTGARSCFFRPLPACRGRSREVRRHQPEPRGAEFAGAGPAGHGAGHPAAAGRQRDRGRRLPQARGQPAGHGAARVGRAGQAVGAVQLRRRPQRRRAHRDRRRHAVARRADPGADRRPAGRSAGGGPRRWRVGCARRAGRTCHR